MTDISRQLERVLDAKERQKAVLFEAFEAPVEVDHWAYLDNPIAPTLGDPDAISKETGNTYEVDALLFMNDICDRKMQGWLDEATAMRIKQEVADSHRKRCVQNRDSMARIREHVFYKGIDSLSIETMATIQAVRSGSATSADRLSLLGQFPAGISIEDMKYTCPFDINGLKDVVALYTSMLRDLKYVGCEVELHTKDQQRPELDLSMVQQRGILLTKVPLAGVRSNDAIFESMLRINYVMLPPTMETPADVVDNFVTFNGECVNLQPLFVTGYPKFIKYAEVNDAPGIYFSQNGEAQTLTL